MISLRFGQDGGWPKDDGVERKFIEVDGVEHFDMVKNQEVLDAITSFIGLNASHLELVESSSA